MDETFIGPKKYVWKTSSDTYTDGRKIGNNNYVLVKKSFIGRIKAKVQELDEEVEIVSYKTIKIKIDELSSDNLYYLIEYFTKRRLNKQVDLLIKELEYRKKLLVDPDTPRPAELRNSLKIKYNIVKKTYKEKKYESKKVKLPKKDFIFIYTTNRLLYKYVNKKMGISFNVVFNIINAKEYMKQLKKFENKGQFDETKLFENIEKEIRSIIDDYLSTISYQFTDKEELLSDAELNNKIKIKCLEYGIEIPSIRIALSNVEKLRQAGLTDERISLISGNDDKIADYITEQKQRDKEKEIKSLIKKLQAIGVDIDDDGYISELADTIAREYGDVDPATFINIRDLNSAIINEICRAYTSPIKIR